MNLLIFSQLYHLFTHSSIPIVVLLRKLIKVHDFHWSQMRTSLVRPQSLIRAYVVLLWKHQTPMTCFKFTYAANCQCHHEIWHITDISIVSDRSAASVDWSCSSWPHWFWFKVFLEIINTNELRGTTWENVSLERAVDKSPTWKWSILQRDSKEGVWHLNVSRWLYCLVQHIQLYYSRLYVILLLYML